MDFRTPAVALVALALCGAGVRPTRGAELSIPACSPAAPAVRDDGWTTACPDSLGLAPELLLQMESAFERRELAEPDAIVVAKDGKLAYERYSNGFDGGTQHDLRSATKSITSLLVGIAIARGALAGVGAAALPLLPEAKAALAAEPRKKAITLEHLLTMSSGLDCDDWDPRSPGQEDKMYRSRNWVRFVLDLGMKGEPGPPMRYCTGGVVLLGAILAQATRTTVPAFADEALFRPLRFGPHAWEATPEKGTDSGGHLKLLPRDFAKIGQLLLDDGKSQGKVLVSSAWIADSTRSRGHLGDSDYGCLWWRNTFTVQGKPVAVIFARGNGGQYLFVAPELRLVAAFNGSRYNRPEGDQAIAIFGRFLLPAALGSGSR